VTHALEDAGDLVDELEPPVVGVHGNVGRLQLERVFGVDHRLGGDLQLERQVTLLIGSSMFEATLVLTTMRPAPNETSSGPRVQW